MYCNIKSYQRHDIQTYQTYINSQIIFRFTFHYKMMLEKMQNNVKSGYYDQI